MGAGFDCRLWNFSVTRRKENGAKSQKGDLMKLLILGAGASKPFGFPTGEELSEKIRTGLESIEKPFFRDVLAASRFEGLEASESNFEELGNALLYNPSTIDRLIHEREELKDAGKLSIARALIPLEDPSNLTAPAGKATDNGQFWVDVLFRHLAGFDGPEATEKWEEFAILTFNYDRSFEHAMAERCYSVFGEERAEEALDKIQVVHLHGSLGRHPRFPISIDTIHPPGPDFEFEPSFRHERLAEAASNIRTMDFTEADRYQFGDNYEDSVDAVAFLGFSYAPENLQRAGLRRTEDMTNHHPRVFGTTLGLTRKEIMSTKKRLQQYFGVRVNDFTGWGNEYDNLDLLIKSDFLV